MFKATVLTALFIAAISCIGVALADHSSESLEVRVAARSTDNDRIEFAIQQRLPDGSWSDYKFGSARFFGPALHDGEWKHATAVEVEVPISHAPASATAQFGDGTWLVGSDIQAGTYRTSNPSGSCYWARLSGLGGELDDIIANDFTDDPAIVEIKLSDKAFDANDCGTWQLVE